MNENMTDSRTLFFSPEEEKDFQTVLKDVQEYISSKYSTLILDGDSEEVKQHIKRYISKYVMDYRIQVKGMVFLTVRRVLLETEVFLYRIYPQTAAMWTTRQCLKTLAVR